MNLKMVVRKICHRIGFEINKIEKGKKYTMCTPYGYTTYTPWFEEWFQDIYSKIKDHTVVTEDRCYMIHELCIYCSHYDGDFAECGVYKGGTAYLIALTLSAICIQKKELHLFDTFHGMPAIADNDPSSHKKRDFGDTRLKYTKNYLRDFPFIVYHPGIIPTTLSDIEDKNFAFIHIDVDLYQTTKECCNFFYERMVKGGIMIFDDYGFPGYCNSEKKAVDEFFSDKPEIPITLRSGQCLVIKL